MPELQWLLAAIPNFARYIVVSFALLFVFIWVYTLLTPWREFALIRQGNTAAAVALVGALLGFCLPLAIPSRIRPASPISSCGPVSLWSSRRWSMSACVSCCRT